MDLTFGTIFCLYLCLIGKLWLFYLLQERHSGMIVLLYINELAFYLFLGKYGNI